MTIKMPAILKFQIFLVNEVVRLFSTAWAAQKQVNAEMKCRIILTFLRVEINVKIKMMVVFRLVINAVFMTIVSLPRDMLIDMDDLSVLINGSWKIGKKFLAYYKKPKLH
jgi:hypothetical protein